MNIGIRKKELKLCLFEDDRISENSQRINYRTLNKIIIKDK